MSFSKTFPRTIETSNYPIWEEFYLTDKEERLEEDKARKENIRVMLECVEDARNILEDKELKNFQTNIVRVAIALFAKRASHEVYWKERRCKDKFDKVFNAYKA
jgi:hypothetical protein